jgi:hypothetical protein
MFVVVVVAAAAVVVGHKQLTVNINTRRGREQLLMITSCVVVVLHVTLHTFQSSSPY